MHSLLLDLRYSVRNLMQARGFAAIAILTLALGIGATSAMFSVVNSVLLRPLPYYQPERLVALNVFNTEHGRSEIAEGSMSYPDYRDVAARNHSFEEASGYTFAEYPVTGAGEPIHVEAQIVSANLFHLLRVQPVLGRSFLPEEDSAGHHVAILSNAFWHSHFNGDKAVVGKTIALRGYSYTIVGVMPPGFQFAARSKPSELWVTYSG